MAMDVDLHVMLGGNGGDSDVDKRLRSCLVVQCIWPDIDPKHGEVGDNIIGRTAVNFCGIDLQPSSDSRLQPKCKIGSSDKRVATLFGITPGMSRSAMNREREIAASRPSSGQCAVGKSRRFIGQCRALASCSFSDQRGGARRR